MVNRCCKLERELWKTHTHNVNCVSISVLRKDVITHDNVLIVFEGLIMSSLFLRNLIFFLTSIINQITIKQ